IRLLVVPAASQLPTLVPPPSFFFYCYGHHRALPSFPTRRSSDLLGWTEDRIREHFSWSETLLATLEKDHIGTSDEALLDIYRKRSEEHTSELQSLTNLVCRLLLEKKKKRNTINRRIKNTTSCNHS